MYIYSSVNIISAHYDLSLSTQSETMSDGVLACKGNSLEHSTLQIYLI